MVAERPGLTVSQESAKLGGVSAGGAGEESGAEGVGLLRLKLAETDVPQNTLTRCQIIFFKKKEKPCSLFARLVWEQRPNSRI